MAAAALRRETCISHPHTTCWLHQNLPPRNPSAERPVSPGPIAALSFGESPSGQTRLFSLGADGRVLEFDLRSTTALRLLAMHDAAPPGAGAPSALCFAPPMPYWAKSSTETLLVVAGELSAGLPPLLCRVHIT